RPYGGVSRCSPSRCRRPNDSDRRRSAPSTRPRSKNGGPLSRRRESRGSDMIHWDMPAVHACLRRVEGGTMNILTVNLVLSTLVFWIAARIYLIPKLGQLEASAVVLPILLLHAMRHLGLMFLAPGAVYYGMPLEFATRAAY